MIEWINYFDPLSGFGAGLGMILLFSGLLVGIVLFNMAFFFKAVREFRNNNVPILKNSRIRQYALIMISLILIPIGNIIAMIVLVLTDGKYLMFTAHNKIFDFLGILFAVALFGQFIATILHSPFFQRTEAAWNRAFQIITIIFGIIAIIMLGRFILLGFQPFEFRETTAGFIEGILVFGTAIATVISIIACYYLYQERKSVSSQLKKAQMNAYIIYPISISVFTALNFIAVLAFVLQRRFGITLAEGVLFIIQFLAYILTAIAMLSLYYGMFTPQSLLVRTKVISET